MDLTTLTRQELKNRAEFCAAMAAQHPENVFHWIQWRARAREAEKAIQRYDAEQAKLGAWPGRPLAGVAPPTGES